MRAIVINERPHRAIEVVELEVFKNRAGNWGARFETPDFSELLEFGTGGGFYRDDLDFGFYARYARFRSKLYGRGKGTSVEIWLVPESSEEESEISPDYGDIYTMHYKYGKTILFVPDEYFVPDFSKLEPIFMERTTEEIMSKGRIYRPPTNKGSDRGGKESPANFTDDEEGSSAEYSQKEQQLFCALGYPDLQNQDAATAYMTLAIHCFSRGVKGRLAGSVQRCYNAMQAGSPKRLTPEFDDLIRFAKVSDAPGN